MIDWIGYYCDNTTRCQLNIPTTSISSLRHDHNDTPPPSSSPSFYSSSKVVQEILDPLPIFHSVENYYCCIGDQDVIPALEMGLRFMNVHSTIIPSSNTNNMNENDDIEKNNNNMEDKNIDSSDLHNNNSVTLSDTIQPPLAVALIYSHSKYAYGLSSRTYTYTTSSTTSAITDRPIATTTYTLPPLSNVIYKVTLKHILPSVTASNTNDPKVLLQLYQCKKLLANDIYQNDIQMTPKKKKNGNGNGSTTNDDTTIADESKHDNSTNNTYHLHRAIRIYQRTVEQLENFMIELQQQQQLQLQSSLQNDATTLSYITEARQLQLDCLNNISAVYMKCHYYHKAKEACVQTLLKDSNNSKALFRAAKAALYDPASSYDEVQATLRAVQDLVRTTSDTTNTNNNTRTLQRDLELLQKEYHQHEMKYKQQQKVMAARIQQKMKSATTSSTKNATTALIDSESNIATLQIHNDNKKNVSPDINHMTSTNTMDHNNNRTIQSILSSFHSTPTLSNNTKQILYRILQVIILLFLLLYMYIYFHVLNVTVTTTTTTIPVQEL